MTEIVDNLDGVYAPLCHPGRSRVGNLDTCLGGSEWPVCFSCFLEALAARDCPGYASLAALIESGDRRDEPCRHLTVWVASRFACECPVCGAHDRVPPSRLEICADRLTRLACVRAGHDQPTGIAPHSAAA